MKLPFGDVPLPDEPRAQLGGARGQRRRRRRPPGELRGRRAGRRRARERARPSRRRSTSSSRWARSCTPTSGWRPTGRVGGAGGARRRTPAPARCRVPASGQVVARLDAASEIARGEEAELWVDTTKLHLFDPRPAASLGPPGGPAAGRGQAAAGGGRRSESSLGARSCSPAPRAAVRARPRPIRGCATAGSEAHDAQ